MNLLLCAQILVPLIILGIFYVFITLYRQYHFRKKSRSPFTDAALLRLPGHSLRLQIGKLTESIDEYLLFLFLITITVVNYLVFFVSHQGVEKASYLIMLSVITLAILVFILLFKMTKK